MCIRDSRLTYRAEIFTPHPSIPDLGSRILTELLSSCGAKLGPKMWKTIENNRNPKLAHTTGRITPHILTTNVFPLFGPGSASIVLLYQRRKCERWVTLMRKNYNEKTHGSRFRPIDCGALSRMPGPNKYTTSRPIAFKFSQLDILCRTNFLS